jgi:hypothetical protein
MKPRACAMCGEYHPVDHDGITIYYDCLPGIAKGKFLEALLAKGCAPKKVKPGSDAETHANELARQAQAREDAEANSIQGDL